MAKNKKRKKKPCVNARLDRKQYNNELKRKIKAFAEEANILDAYNLIPPIQIEVCLAMGIKPVNLIDKNEEHIPVVLMRMFKQVVHKCLKRIPLDCGTGKNTISLYDFFAVGEPLTYLLRTKGISFKNKEKAELAAKHYMDAIESGGQATDKAIDLAYYLTHNFFSPTFGFVLFKFGFDQSHTKAIAPIATYYITLIEAEQKKVNINGHRRTVYRLGCPSDCEKVEWASCEANQIADLSSFTGLKIDIYIQNHALNRLYERLDCIDKPLIYSMLMGSLMKFNTTTNRKGQHLITLNIGDHTIGYMPYQYIEGIVVITTFLLKTSNNTPEGDRLQDLLGIDKLDKQYLGIDRLSTFVYSDLKDNDYTFSLFAQVNCDDLFNLPIQGVIKHEKEEGISDQFFKYLELDEAFVSSHSAESTIT